MLALSELNAAAGPNQRPGRSANPRSRDKVAFFLARRVIASEAGWPRAPIFEPTDRGGRFPACQTAFR